MVEVEEQPSKTSIKPSDLPEDERHQLFDSHEIQQQQQEADLDSSPSGAQFWQDKATDAMRYWSQFTNYTLELDDGSKLRIYRVPATKLQLRQLNRASSEVAAGGTVIKNGKLKLWNPIEAQLKAEQLEELKVSIYLRDEETNKPPAMDKILRVVDSGDIDGILEACYAISVSKWHQPKKG